MQALERSFLETLLHTASEGVIVQDVEGRIVFCNTAAERMLGLANSRLIDKTSNDLAGGTVREDGTPFPASEHPSMVTLRTGRPCTNVVMGVKHAPDHPRTWIRINSAIIPAPASRGRMVFTIFADVTAQITAQRHLLETSRHLQQVNRALRMLSSAGKALIHAADESSLLLEVCRVVVDVGGYRMAIALAEPDAANVLRPVACAGLGTGNTDGLGFDWSALDSPGGLAIRTGQPCVISDISAEPAFAHWRGETLRRDCRSAMVLSLSSEGRTLGVLAIFASAAENFDAEDAAFLKELANDLAYGITTLRIRTERRQMEQALIGREQGYRTLVENIPDLIVRYDLNLQRIFVNPAWEKAAGLSAAEVIDIPAAEVRRVPNLDTPSYTEKLRAALESETVQHIEFTWTNAWGATLHLEYAITPEFDQNGKVVSLLAIGHDITERKRMEAGLRIAASAFEAQEGIVITDTNQVILRVNRAFSAITGYAPADAVGQTPKLLKSGRHDAIYYQAMWDCIHQYGAWQGEIWNRRRSGEIYPEWLSITAVRSDAGEVTNYVGTLIDISARKAAEKEIEYLAFYDPLTQLPNRRLFLDRLRQALAGMAGHESRGAILFIDLDNFKTVNDTCGHEVGDRLLVETARRLITCVRDDDTIARLGGDEFIVMLENLSEDQREAAAQARIIGEKILAALNRPYSIAGRQHHSTPSIGVTLFFGTTNSQEELLKQADIAMYQAKSAGRNTLRFFDPDMQASLVARSALEAALVSGVRDRQFVLHYQPQVHGTHGVVGAEALVRWEHPERGLVPPAEFIPMAEQIGLILPIGQWVLEAACGQLRRWADAPGTRHLDLAVNVSAHQFRQADFVDSVRLALNIAAAPAVRLKLELTESLVLDNIEDTIEKMHALKRLGVGFSIDDFGTGYSSLSYLTRLPLEQLKIDQSFVRHLPHNPNDAVIVQTIITMARSLGLTVIAEGVETEAQRQFLDRNGCQTCQGDLFSKPVALEQFERLLTNTAERQWRQ